MAYVPSPLPIDEDKLASRVWFELEQISTELRKLALLTYYVEPNNPYLNQVVLADGTRWNPGSGRGVYIYDAGTWRYLG